MGSAQCAAEEVSAIELSTGIERLTSRTIEIGVNIDVMAAATRMA